MSDEDCILKGRLVHCGNKEYNCFRQNVIDERRRALIDEGPQVKPVSETELRGILALELALAQEGGSTPHRRRAAGVHTHAEGRIRGRETMDIIP